MSPIERKNGLILVAYILSTVDKRRVTRENMPRVIGNLVNKKAFLDAKVTKEEFVFFTWKVFGLELPGLDTKLSFSNPPERIYAIALAYVKEEIRECGVRTLEPEKMIRFVCSLITKEEFRKHKITAKEFVTLHREILSELFADVLNKIKEYEDFMK